MKWNTRALTAPLLAALVSCAACGASPAASHPLSPGANGPAIEASAARAGAPVRRPRFGAFGLDTAGMDPSINPPFNEILFTTAILQAPFFDPEADGAINHGAIGGVIGHELGHGFDDQGSKLDAKGVLRPWWSAADVDAFKTRTDALTAQYDGFEPLPGLKVNGRFTLGENIGDLGGLTIAYTAYPLSLAGKSAPGLDGLTGDQRFFLGRAQIHRSIQRDEALRNQIMSDPHSPARYGVNGVVRNMDAWYTAFDVKEGDALHLPPDRRVHVW